MIFSTLTVYMLKKDRQGLALPVFFYASIFTFCCPNTPVSALPIRRGLCL